MSDYQPKTAGEALALLLVALLIIPISCGLSEWQCASRARKMGFNGDWGPIDGCMVQVDERWIPIESYRTVAE